MARGAGIVNAHTIRDVEDFKTKGIGALSRDELAFFVCKVDESLLHREIPRPNTDLAENKYTFVRYLERTEGKSDAVYRARIEHNFGGRECELRFAKNISMIVAAVWVPASIASTVQAQDFYKDKTVRSLSWRYSPGGSFDLYARVIARYIGR